MTRLTALARALAAGLEAAWTVVARLVKIRDGERDELPANWRDEWQR